MNLSGDLVVFVIKHKVALGHTSLHPAYGLDSPSIFFPLLVCHDKSQLVVIEIAEFLSIGEYLGVIKAQVLVKSQVLLDLGKFGFIIEHGVRALFLEFLVAFNHLVPFTVDKYLLDQIKVVLNNNLDLLNSILEVF